MIDRCSKDLDQDQIDRVTAFIRRYRHVFSENGELGKTNWTYHRMETGNCPPFKEAPRRVPFHMTADVEREIENMLSKKVIQPSDSPWASPVVLAREKKMVHWDSVSILTYQQGYTAWCLPFATYWR